MLLEVCGLMSEDPKSAIIIRGVLARIFDGHFELVETFIVLVCLLTTLLFVVFLFICLHYVLRHLLNLFDC